MKCCFVGLFRVFISNRFKTFPFHRKSTEPSPPHVKLGHWWHIHPIFLHSQVITFDDITSNNPLTCILICELLDNTKRVHGTLINYLIITSNKVLFKISLLNEIVTTFMHACTQTRNFLVGIIDRAWYQQLKSSKTKRISAIY